tara:strand:+ start:72 stop:1205 length:1134 start_codon:yes stop_codon:yes gene_type:complete
MYEGQINFIKSEQGYICVLDAKSVQNPKPLEILYDLLKIRKEIDSLKEKRELLRSIPNSVSGEKRHRFATFTARSGSTLLEQFRRQEAPARKAGGSSGVGTGKKSGGSSGVGGSAKFPKKQDDAFRQILQTDSNVEEGMIRQYFAYVDTRMKPQFATKVDIPDEFFQIRVTRDIRAHPDMLRVSKFDLTSLDSYLNAIETDFSANLEAAQELLTSFLPEEKDLLSGPESFTASLSRMSSKGGILVEFDDGSTHHRGTMPFEMRFCPHCVSDWSNSLETALSTNRFQGIPFPPIPILALPLDEIDTLCTENKHTKREGYSHSFDQCTSVEEIEKVANESRDNLGIEKHTTVRIDIDPSNLGKKPASRWSWIRLDFEHQ